MDKARGRRNNFRGSLPFFNSHDRCSQSNRHQQSEGYVLRSRNNFKTNEHSIGHIGENNSKLQKVRVSFEKLVRAKLVDLLRRIENENPHGSSAIWKCSLTMDWCGWVHRCLDLRSGTSLSSILR